jgi:hypothetical protein
MKLLYNGMEITCTPDEFEDLVIRGLLQVEKNSAI